MVIGQLIWFMVDWTYQDVQKLSDFGVLDAKANNDV